jgi:hypothetical protein
MAHPAAPRTEPMTPDEHRQAKLNAQARSIRYRAATALLRVRPIKDPSTAGATSAPSPRSGEEGGRFSQARVPLVSGAVDTADPAKRELTSPDRQGVGVSEQAGSKSHAPSPSRFANAPARADTDHQAAPSPSRVVGNSAPHAQRKRPHPSGAAA